MGKSLQVLLRFLEIITGHLSLPSSFYVTHAYSRALLFDCSANEANELTSTVTKGHILPVVMLVSIRPLNILVLF